MNRIIFRRLVGIVLIESGIILFLIFPPGFHRWGTVAFIVGLVLETIGWRLFGWKFQGEGPPKQQAKEMIRRMNLPLFLGGVVLFIGAVAYAYLTEKLGWPKENQIACLALMVVGIGLFLLSVLRA